MSDKRDRRRGRRRPLPTTAKPQIVVTTAHRRLVAERILQRFGIDPRPVEESPELDLVLMDLDLDSARSTSGRPLTLDDVFRELYTSFENDFHWVPTFGKNRDLASVVPQHQPEPGVTAQGTDHQPEPGGTDTGTSQDPDGDVTTEHQTEPGDEAAPEPVTPQQASWAAGMAPPGAGAGVRVAVADTAVAGRPQFWGRVLADQDSLLATRTDGVLAEAGHGTFVTGLILQAAPGATVHVTRVLDIPGATDSWEVAKRLVRLADDDADVINLSLGCHTGDNKPPLVFTRALGRLGPDVVVVAAAGNFAPDQPVTPVWPAALDGVVAVGATDREGGRATYSPDPASAPWVDVETPGDKITSVFLEGTVTTAVNADGEPDRFEDFEGFAQWSGTSFAAAHVTGLIAGRTRPGQVSAREALARVLHEAGDRRWLP